MQPGIPTYDTPDKVPIASLANPVRDYNSRTAITDAQVVRPLALLRMCRAKVLDDGRVDLGRNLLRPAAGIEEVAGREEIDEKGRVFGLLARTRGLAGALEVGAGQVDLLANVGALGDLVKVLDAGDARGAACHLVGAVVGPVAGVEAEAAPAVLGVERRVVAVAPEQHDLAPGLAQARDARLREPLGPVAAVPLPQVLGELLIRAPARALALDAHDERLGAVGVEEGVNVLEHVVEVLAARQRDGKRAVDQDQVRVARAGLHAHVEEAHAVVQLLPHVDGLAPHRGQGDVAGRAVVRARDGQRRQRPVVAQLVHPGLELGRAEDGEAAGGDDEDGGELEGSIVQLLEHRAASRVARYVDLIPVPFGLKGQPQELVLARRLDLIRLASFETWNWYRDIPSLLGITLTIG